MKMQYFDFSCCGLTSCACGSQLWCGASGQKSPARWYSTRAAAELTGKIYGANSGRDAGHSHPDDVRLRVVADRLREGADDFVSGAGDFMSGHRRPFLQT